MRVISWNLALWTGDTYQNQHEGTRVVLDVDLGEDVGL